MFLLKLNKLVSNKSYRYFSTWFTKTHEYIKFDKKLCTIGLTEYAAESLGEIVYIHFSSVGMDVKKNEVISEIDSIKAVSEVISPVSGKIVDINKEVENNPSLINSSPLDKGWLIKIKSSQKIEDLELLDKNEYINFIKDNE